MNLRATKATVDLDAIHNNIQIIKDQTKGTAICAVVKADAYGHGLIPIGRLFCDLGVEMLAVATCEEALLLRKHGICIQILVFGPSGFDAPLVIKDSNIIPAVFSLAHFKWLSSELRGCKINFHLKIDTGMSRLGILPEEIEQLIKLIKQNKHMNLGGVFTHFANADLGDKDSTNKQLTQFNNMVELLRNSGLEPEWKHAANSAALVSNPETHLNMVRPGLLLYGVLPTIEPIEINVCPALEWTTKPIQVKKISKGSRVSYGGLWSSKEDAQIAILPVGYADGYPRGLTNKSSVIIKGQYAPVIGAVCMDYTIVDISSFSHVELNDTVTLLGKQDQCSISANMLAKWTQSIPYEILTGINMRVPRQYQQSHLSH